MCGHAILGFDSDDDLSDIEEMYTFVNEEFEDMDLSIPFQKDLGWNPGKIPHYEVVSNPEDFKNFKTDPHDLLNVLELKQEHENQGNGV